MNKEDKDLPLQFVAKKKIQKAVQHANLIIEVQEKLDADQNILVALWRYPLASKSGMCYDKVTTTVPAVTLDNPVTDKYSYAHTQQGKFRTVHKTLCKRIYYFPVKIPVNVDVKMCMVWWCLLEVFIMEQRSFCKRDAIWYIFCLVTSESRRQSMNILLDN